MTREIKIEIEDDSNQNPKQKTGQDAEDATEDAMEHAGCTPVIIGLTIIVISLLA